MENMKQREKREGMTRLNVIKKKAGKKNQKKKKEIQKKKKKPRTSSGWGEIAEASLCKAKSNEKHLHRECRRWLVPHYSFSVCYLADFCSVASRGDSHVSKANIDQILQLYLN